MKGALVMFIAKVEGAVKEKFSGAPPQTLTFPPPPIKIPGGATVANVDKIVILTMHYLKTLPNSSEKNT